MRGEFFASTVYLLENEKAVRGSNYWNGGVSPEGERVRVFKGTQNDEKFDYLLGEYDDDVGAAAKRKRRQEKHIRLWIFRLRRFDFVISIRPLTTRENQLEYIFLSI